MNRNGKKPKIPNLLELSEVERIELIRRAKETLREKVVEAKLWRSSVGAENTTADGHSICRCDTKLKGFRFSELARTA